MYLYKYVHVYTFALIKYLQGIVSFINIKTKSERARERERERETKLVKEIIVLRVII